MFVAEVEICANGDKDQQNNYNDGKAITTHYLSSGYLFNDARARARDQLPAEAKEDGGPRLPSEPPAI